ncbi:MAG TPA: bifunctional adenosylcobinamide kinase/adenosylcobinamide-phosphate guanylyltransferase [Steroidobacteraceae bacterium]|nr:bifunctional adenosylcobinamide kinase/adenosylcobinamide-phosphate guanylyltransferase [Steroidobacteraceae bacterium]
MYLGSLTLITGPVRSGKSQLAVERAREWGDSAVFVATYHIDLRDAEMTERVRRHRTARPPWRTLEAPADVAASLTALTPAPSGVIIDCLTLWTSARFADTDEQLKAMWTHQLAALAAAPWPVIIVSNELGWSLVPAEAAARRFRDLAGTLAQLTAAAAEQVWLVVAGCPLRLK